MDRFKMNVVNCAMLGAFVCAMPKQPGERIPAADLPLGANRKKRSASSCRTASAHRAPALDGFDSLPFFPKQKQHPDGMLFCFGAGYGNRWPICPWGQIVRSVRHPAAERQVPAGHLHWMGSIPFLFFQNKTASRWDAVLFWSRVRESNPPLWLGKRPFYR